MWNTIKKIASNNMVQIIGGNIAAATLVSSLTDQGFSGGFQAAGMGIGGADLGYMKGGARGAFFGSLLGQGLGFAANALTPDNAAIKLGLGALTGSVTASLSMSAMMRGGLMYKGYSEALKNIFKQQGISEEQGFAQIGKMAEGILGHNPFTDPRGMAANFSDMLFAGSVSADPNGRFRKAVDWLQNTTWQKRFIDAALGSPALLQLAQNKNGLANATWPELGRAVGQDVLEGIPLAAGAAGLGLLFSGKDDEYNRIEGLRHGGMAQVKRREMTAFGSGLIKAIEDAGKRSISSMSRSEIKSVFKNVVSRNNIRQVDFAPFSGVVDSAQHVRTTSARISNQISSLKNFLGQANVIERRKIQGSIQRLNKLQKSFSGSEEKEFFYTDSYFMYGRSNERIAQATMMHEGSEGFIDKNLTNRLRTEMPNATQADMELGRQEHYYKRYLARYKQEQKLGYSPTSQAPLSYEEFLKSNNETGGFGTHWSPAVIGEELRMAAAMGPEEYIGFKSLRRKEMAAIKEEYSILEKEASAVPRNAGEASILEHLKKTILDPTFQREKSAKLFYIDRYEKILAAFEQKHLPKYNAKWEREALQEERIMNSRQANRIAGLAKIGLGANEVKKAGFGSPYKGLFDSLTLKLLGNTMKYSMKGAYHLGASGNIGRSILGGTAGGLAGGLFADTNDPNQRLESIRAGIVGGALLGGLATTMAKGAFFGMKGQANLITKSAKNTFPRTLNKKGMELVREGGAKDLSGLTRDQVNDLAKAGLTTRSFKSKELSTLKWASNNPRLVAGVAAGVGIGGFALTSSQSTGQSSLPSAVLDMPINQQMAQGEEQGRYAGGTIIPVPNPKLRDHNYEASTMGLVQALNNRRHG